MECRAIVPKQTTLREVLPSRLYISSASDVTPPNISYFQITHIVNCTYSVPLYRHNSFPNSLRLAIRDVECEQICPYFERFYDHACDIFDNDCDSRILVHCKAGISRSATLILAFLMRYRRMPLNDAFEYLLERRGFICPNLGFWNQLRDFDLKLFGKHSVEMIKYKGIELPAVVFKRRPKSWYIFSALETYLQQQRRKERSNKKAIAEKQVVDGESEDCKGKENVEK